MPSWYRNVIFSWLESSDDVQTVALALLYMQVLCGLVGSLGALYTGVVVANLVVALFGIIAIASGYQTLARAYVLFLACLLVLDVVWFSFFSEAMRRFPSESPFGGWARLSLAVTLYSECVGFSVRLLSAPLWLQMYRLGTSAESGAYDPVPCAGSTPGSSPLRRYTSLSDEVLGTTIYNPAAYASLFSSSNQGYFAPEDPHCTGNWCRGQRRRPLLAQMGLRSEAAEPRQEAPAPLSTVGPEVAHNCDRGSKRP